MRADFYAARRDIAAALEMNPRLPAAYGLLIGIAQSSGDEREAREFLRRAIAILPTTMLNRAAFMMVLLPRWGGSFEAMKSFADECDSVAITNPRLMALRGFINYERAETLLQADMLEEAWAELEKGIQFGELAALRELRGQVAMRRGRALTAVEEYDRALRLTPNDADILYARSYAAMEAMRKALNPRFIGLVLQATRDGERAAALQPWRTDLQQWAEAMRRARAEVLAQQLAMR
jgi:tetratricopeptide (TPR) repeat protein